MKYFYIFITLLFIFWPSYFLFTLSLFRQKKGANIRNIIMSSIVMAHVSLAVQFFSIQYMISLVQLFAIVLCMCLIYKFRLSHSILISVIVYTFQFILEISYTFLLTRFQIDQFLKSIQENVILPAISMAGINLLICLLLHNFRLGFTFIPVYRSVRRKSSNVQLNLFVVFAVFLNIISCLNLNIYQKYVIENAVIMSILLLFIFYFLSKKELMDT